jgi:hypothetical protein
MLCLELFRVYCTYVTKIKLGINAFNMGITLATLKLFGTSPTVKE